MNPTYSRSPSPIVEKSRTTSPTPNKYMAKGHDAQLQNAMYGKNEVQLQIMGSDREVHGTILRRDKFTITLTHLNGHINGENVSGMDEIFYKHAIESVLIRPQPASAL